MMNKTVNKLFLPLAICLLALWSVNAFAQQGQGKSKEKEKSEVKMTKDDTLKHGGIEKEKNQVNKPGGKENAPGKTEKEKQAGGGSKEIVKDTTKIHEGEGNAYGKNKDTLTGREFGQARSEQAKMNKELKETELDSSVVEAEKKIADAKTKIKTSKEKLEKDKKEKKISDADYATKKKQIEDAEQAVKELEEKVKKGKSIE